MKKIIVMSIIIAITAWRPAFAGMFGAPEPVARESRPALSLGYLYYQNDWNLKEHGSTHDYKFKQHQVYVQLSAATNNIEGYLRVGGASLKVDDAYVSGEPFSDSGKIFSEIGAKGFYKMTPDFGFGPFFQASLFDNFNDLASGTNVTFTRLWELDGGFAFQFILNRLTFYAGPFFYLSQAKSESPTETLSWESKNNFGGMAGIRVNAGRNVSMQIEGQYRSGLSAGTMINYSF